MAGSPIRAVCKPQYSSRDQSQVLVNEKFEEVVKSAQDAAGFCKDNCVNGFFVLVFCFVFPCIGHEIK